MYTHRKIYTIYSTVTVRVSGTVLTDRLCIYMYISGDNLLEVLGKRLVDLKSKQTACLRWYIYVYTWLIRAIKENPNDLYTHMLYPTN